MATGLVQDEETALRSSVKYGCLGFEKRAVTELGDKRRRVKGVCRTALIGTETEADDEGKGEIESSSLRLKSTGRPQLSFVRTVRGVDLSTAALRP